MQQPDMPPPPVAPAPQSSPWVKLTLIIVAGVVALAVLSGVMGNVEHAASSTTTRQPVTTVDDLITAAMVVDAMQESQRQEFCTAYFTLNDYDLGLQFFSRHYDVPNPSAQEVYDELVSRC